jgi:hypothetical protein
LRTSRKRESEISMVVFIDPSLWLA